MHGFLFTSNQTDRHTQTDTHTETHTETNCNENIIPSRLCGGVTREKERKVADIHSDRGSIDMRFKGKFDQVVVAVQDHIHTS